MCRAFGVDGYDDPRLATPALRQHNSEVARAVFERCCEVAARMTTKEAMARMEAERVPCGVVLSPAELADDPHVRAIGLFVDDVHPLVGRIRRPRHPARFDGTPAALGGPAPTLGAHTDAILVEIGIGERAQELRAAGVVA